MNVGGTRNVLDAAHAVGARVVFVELRRGLRQTASRRRRLSSKTRRCRLAASTRRPRRKPRRSAFARRERADRRARSGVQPHRPRPAGELRVQRIFEAGRAEPAWASSRRSSRSAISPPSGTSRTCATSFAPTSSALECGAPAAVYNVCSGVPTRIGALLDQLIEIAGVRGGRCVPSAIDCALARSRGSGETTRRFARELGWSSTISAAHDTRRPARLVAATPRSGRTFRNERLVASAGSS